MDTWFHGHLSDEKDEKPEDFGVPHKWGPQICQYFQRIVSRGQLRLGSSDI